MDKPEILKMRMPAGTYFVGDPCYMFNDGWDKVLEITDFYNTKFGLFKGRWLWGDNTAYGDGGYRDDRGREYDVDAGLIGVTPIELLESDMEYLKGSGQIITFDEPFTVSCEDGIFNIADFEIDTKNDFWYDEDEEDW